MPPRQAWCSVRLRFSSEELALLRGAESLQGQVLARDQRASSLRDALTLMKAGHRLAAAHPNSSIMLGEAETAALRDALRSAQASVGRYHDHVLGWRGQQPLAPEDAVLVEAAFPQLKGSAWEASRLQRDLKALLDRFETPLAGG